MNTMKPLTVFFSPRRMVMGTAVVLVGLLALGFILSRNASLRQPAFAPARGQTVGAWGPVSLSFSTAMVQTSVEKAIQISPETAGVFRWTGNTVLFFPRTALQDNTLYTLELKAGAESLDGHILEHAASWQFQVRAADVVYLHRGPEGTESDLERVRPDGSDRVGLTHTTDRVIDFGVSWDGEWIVYAAANPQGGADLWKVDRDGKRAARIVVCGEERCDQPALSRDGSRIAYRRSGPGENQDTGGVIWVWEGELDRDRASGNRSVGAGTQPAWAPYGNSLAYLDAPAQKIHLIDFDRNDRVDLPIRSGLMGSWAPDSLRFVFTDLQQTGMEPSSNLFIADLDGGNVSPAPIDRTDLLDLGSPVFTADGKGLTVNARPIGAPMGKQLWRILPSGEVREITDDPTSAHTAYHWSPDGDWLAFQRYGLGSSSSTPEVVIWRNTGTGGDESFTVLAQNAVQPEWLP